MRITNNPKTYRSWNSKTKFLIISGAEDPVGTERKGPQSIYDQMTTAGLDNVKLEFVPGRHDIFHEYGNGSYDRVVDILLSFILE